MKTLYGVQLGNYLKHKDKIIKVNGMTKKKVGSLGDDGEERYYYLQDISGIPLTSEILKKHEKHFDDWKEVGGEFYIIPEGSGNLYIIKWFHELQNILELHNHRIEWID